jgi:FkbM family methyltransferase
MVIGLTSRLPPNYFGLRVAIGLRLVIRRLSRDEGIDVVRWGKKIRLHPLRNGCEKGLLFTPQMFEVVERRALTKEIGSHSRLRPFVFIDIGANVGLFSLFVAAASKGNARILAFEPEPENVRRLRFNASANADTAIKIFPIALGDQSGRIGLRVDQRDRGGTNTVPPGDQCAIDIQCLPLLSTLSQEGIEWIDALKIDVEGDEDRVLMPFFQEAPQHLWPAFIVIEDARPRWRTDVIGHMVNIGYRVTERTKLNVLLHR